MADQDERNERSNVKNASESARRDQQTDANDDGLERNNDPDSQKSSASRPRGHTEELDRTL